MIFSKIQEKLRNQRMAVFSLSSAHENKIICLGIIVFWWLFWLFNVIDKFIGGKTFLWAGKDRYAQLVAYFSLIGVDNSVVIFASLFITTLLEVLALLFATFALAYCIAGNKKIAHGALFLTILTSLAIFSLFAIGDQVFGDRFELMEHTLYWIAFVFSWFLYTQHERDVYS
ncbi:MAG: hypothetical protein IID61_17515 [SAR324 cluster bacterium]|nr:hypothetical protein [SAR324 cluster bacterium]